MSQDPPKPRRSKGAWVLLLSVWLVGLCVLGVYILMAGMLLNRAATASP